MATLVEKTKSQRKTFTLPNYIVKELEKYSKKLNKKQSQMVAVALEEYLNKQKADMNKKEKKLNALQDLVGILPNGSLKDKKIQDMLGKRG